MGTAKPLLASLLARSMGRFLAESATRELNPSKDLEGLKTVLIKLFSWEEGFAVESGLEGVRTRGKCPVHRYAPFWCDNGCTPFIKGFAEVFNVEAERIEKQPEKPYCAFAFKLRRS